MPIVVFHQSFIYYPCLSLRYTSQPTTMNPSCHDIEFCWIQTTYLSPIVIGSIFNIFHPFIFPFRIRKQNQESSTVAIVDLLLFYNCLFPVLNRIPMCIVHVCVASMFYPFRSFGISEERSRSAYRACHKTQKSSLSQFSN